MELPLYFQVLSFGRIFYTGVELTPTTGATASCMLRCTLRNGRVQDRFNATTLAGRRAYQGVYAVFFTFPA
jgi:hypothetical protein